MEYTIGAYTLDVEKPFKSMDAAVKFTQERHPELSREEIEGFIHPKIEDHESDRSGGVSEPVEESGKAAAKTDKGRNRS